MIIKRLLHILLYTIALITLIQWLRVGYYKAVKYFTPPIPTNEALAVPKGFRATLAIPDSFLSYNFAHMFEVIDAAQKAKYLEYDAYLRGKSSAIPTNTLVALAQDLYHEKVGFKQFIRSTRENNSPLSTKRTRALQYYLRVLDLHLQDVDNMIAKRTERLPASH